jgi:hypothetical protein
MWDQFIESKTTLNPSVKESEMLKNLFARLSNTKNSSKKGGAIDTDPESFIVDIIQQPWDRRGAITIVPIMVNGSVTHFEAIDKDGSTLKIDATSDQIEVVMQTIDEFLAVNPITVTEEGGSRVIENFDNVASVLSAAPDRDWNNLRTRLKIFLFFMVATALMAAGVATTLVLAPHLVAIPAAIGGYVAACYLIQFITLTLWRSERYLRVVRWIRTSWRKLRATRGNVADMTSLPKATLDGLPILHPDGTISTLKLSEHVYPAEHISTDEHVPEYIVYSDDSYNMLHVPYSYKVDNLAYDLPVHVDDWSDAVHESKDSASSDSDDSDDSDALDFNTFKTNNDDDNLNYRIPDSTHGGGNRAKAIPAWVLACMAIIPLVMSGINR